MAKAGTHSTVIEAAAKLVEKLDKVARVSRGVIKANAKSRSRTIKILRLGGGWRLTLVAKNAKQEFHLFDVSLAQLKEILSEKEFSSFEKIFPNEAE